MSRTLAEASDFTAAIAGAVVMPVRADERDRYSTTPLSLLAIADVRRVDLRLNPERQQALGHPVEQLVGTGLVDHAHPDDVAATGKRFRKVRDGGSVHGLANRVRRADGVVRDSLAMADIGHLMERPADAPKDQSHAEVTLDTQVHTTPPEEVQVAFYRIAQEAFSTIAKHSRAVKVEAQTVADAEGVVLTVHDNGVGFAPSSISADHRGLPIIRERADEIGADVGIESAPGAGAQIIVGWPSSKEEEAQRKGGETTWPTSNASE
jgi:hypothetical protein